jgi:hypothetical protein
LQKKPTYFFLARRSFQALPLLSPPLSRRLMRYRAGVKLPYSLLAQHFSSNIYIVEK